MANTILNTEYPDISYNVVGTHGYIFNRGTNLHFNPDMSQWAQECQYLNYNLSNCNINYAAVNNMYETFDHCSNITGAPWVTPEVVNMYRAYNGCMNLTGAPYCGPKTNDMYMAYYGCRNMIGSPVCGPNVVNLASAYVYCQKLTGRGVSGPNVTDMDGTYSATNITYGESGPLVESMRSTYSYCNYLTTAEIGNNVSDIDDCFYHCPNLRGNINWFYNGDGWISFSSAFARSTTGSSVSRLNLHVPNNSFLLYYIVDYGYEEMCIDIFSWRHNASNKCYYNTWGNVNLYVYYNHEIPW